MNFCFPIRRRPKRIAAPLLGLLGALGALTACSADGPSRPAAAQDPGTEETTGLETIEVDQAVERLADPAEGLVLIDMRTPEEFDSGHLEGATLLDFYEPDFAAKLAELDRKTPYLIYCRSGNRSGQALTLMQDLGFTDVANIDGGVLAWEADGRPLVTR